MIRRDLQELRRQTSRPHVEPTVIVQQLDNLAGQVATLQGSGEAGPGQAAFLRQLEALLAENLVALRQEVATTAANAISGPAELIRRDVASLKEIQASVDRRTQDTFEAVYGTVERIADRLAAIEDELRERNSGGDASTPVAVERPPADDPRGGGRPAIRPAPAPEIPDETPGAMLSDVTGTLMLRQPAVLPDAAVEPPHRRVLIGTEEAGLATWARSTIAPHGLWIIEPQHKAFVIGLAVALLLLVGLTLTLDFYRAPAQPAGDTVGLGATPAAPQTDGEQASAAVPPDKIGEGTKHDVSTLAGGEIKEDANPDISSARTATAAVTADAAPWHADSLMRNLVVPAPAGRDPWPQSSLLSTTGTATSSPPIGSKVLVAAAEAGDPGASYEIGVRLAQGYTAAQDYTRAAVFLDRAAKAGLAPAQFSLGGLYEKGLGVRKDLAEARRLYLAAAAKGHARAMHKLAVLYTRGINGRSDYATAADWFRKAAAYGTVDSQYNLGILYARGIGVERDPVEAYKWFALAAKGGDKDALRERDEVAKSLDPQQLEAVGASVEKFVALAQPAQATATGAPAGGWDQVAGAATTKTGPPARPERFPGK
jgi:localization factor PodJL